MTKSIGQRLTDYDPELGHIFLIRPNNRVSDDDAKDAGANAITAPTWKAVENEIRRLEMIRQELL